MNCKHCDYPLWNLRSRQCPECGQAFQPSDFRFALNSVRFCCPHCGQDYYGTGVNGHLVPRTFDCVSCGRHIDMDEMVLLPTEGVEERLTRADVNPWLDAEHRFLRRWWNTLLRGMSNPVWLVRATPVETPPGRAWGFAVATFTIYSAFMLLPWLAWSVLMGAAFGAPGMMVGSGVLGVLLIGLVLTVGTLAFMGVWVAVAHVVLRLGGTTAAGVGRTAQAICFTCGPQAVTLVPCIGPYLAWASLIWWSISAGLALAGAQRVSGGRAALAIAVFPVVCAALLIAAIVTMASNSVRFTSTGAGAWTMNSPASVAEFVEPVRGAGASGAYPAHAGEWIADGTLLPREFVSPYSATMPGDARIMGVTLDRLGEIAPSARQGVVDRAVAALPAPGAPHRVGDFVFALDALPHARSDPSLWVVIEAWDPRFNAGARGAFGVVAADGRILNMSAGNLQSALNAQNQSRAAVGLPPLPHPQSIPEAGPISPGDP